MNRDKIQKKLYQIFESSDKRRSADYFADKLEDKYIEMYESENEEDVEDYFETDEVEI